MHLLVRETRSLDEAEAAVDLGHARADLVFMSFSDSDLGSAAAAPLPPGTTLRVVNLGRLRHPMSVDLYLETVITHARAVVVRLLGGIEYWNYGAEELAALARAHRIPLALLPGDGRDDAVLRGLSTLAHEHWTRLDTYLREGGAANAAGALALAAHIAGLGPDPARPASPLPAFGEHGDALPGESRAAIVFYRSHLLANDIAPIEALATALHKRGLAVRRFFLISLKDPEAARFVADELASWRPAIVLNATAFSAPLEAAGAPVLQVVLSGSAREAWEASPRGLSPSDLAMHVVLPECSGRLATAPISFKEEQEGRGHARHAPFAEGIALVADRALGWARLADTPRSERRLAIVLSDYPGGGQVGHAVGLDIFASLAHVLPRLAAAGYTCAVDPIEPGAPDEEILDARAYQALYEQLPETFRLRVENTWGPPAAPIRAAVHRRGSLLVALQPDRGSALDRRATYHDPDLPPCHAYVGFYLWLREAVDVHALIHLGAHGTLEWLPGKAAAPSAGCAPTALLRGLPVIYPYIVNNPGEAAAAKRRLGAVTIGHLTPPLRPAGLSGAAFALERLIDEYAAADGLDSRRTALLRRDIIERARETGLLAESGADGASGEDDALARLDAYLCDVKVLQIRDGLHVFGRAPAPQHRDALLAAIAATCAGSSSAALRLDACAPAEMAALLSALDGRFVTPGPAGTPTRGRLDVLPTGRNLTTVDPRAVPTRAAMTLARGQAEELVRRYLQDHGDWPRRLVLNLWGSATMRTGGEAFGMALVLLGAQPLWDSESGRVTGIEILPLALLDRPRVDVSLRISGLFRDAFPAQLTLFAQAVRAVAGRDEDPAWNPLAGHTVPPSRIWGAAPRHYGAGATLEMLRRGAWGAAAELGAAYAAASCHTYDAADEGTPDPRGFAALLAATDAFVHAVDTPETDVLDGPELAAHLGGFAAAAPGAAVYCADHATPTAPRTRTVAEEVRRVTRGRLANPVWIEAMMRHGYRGGSEMARGLDALHAFAATLPDRFDAQFELVFDATLGHADVDAFLRHANPEARKAMAARFADALQRGLWRTRRNAPLALMEAESQ